MEEMEEMEERRKLKNNIYIYINNKKKKIKKQLEKQESL